MAIPLSSHQFIRTAVCLPAYLPAESKDIYGLDPIRMKELVLSNTDINWVVS